MPEMSFKASFDISIWILLLSIKLMAYNYTVGSIRDSLVGNDNIRDDVINVNSVMK